MKSCQKCGAKNPTKHHILPQCFFKGIGGICYLCRFHHDEVEARIAKTEKQMSNGKPDRFKLEPKEYREILNDYLNETIPIHASAFNNVVALPRKYFIRNRVVR